MEHSTYYYMRLLYNEQFERTINFDSKEAFLYYANHLLSYPHEMVDNAYKKLWEPEEYRIDFYQVEIASMDHQLLGTMIEIPKYQDLFRCVVEDLRGEDGNPPTFLFLAPHPILDDHYDDPRMNRRAMRKLMRYAPKTPSELRRAIWEPGKRFQRFVRKETVYGTQPSSGRARM